MSDTSPLTVAPLFELPTPSAELRTLERSSTRAACCSRSTAAPGDRTAAAGSVNWHDNSPEYARRGVQVVAVVAQASEPVRATSRRPGLPFNILSTRSREVLKAYGVWHRIGLDAWNIARPPLFLIDRDRLDPLLVHRGSHRRSFRARRDPAALDD